MRRVVFQLFTAVALALLPHAASAGQPVTLKAADGVSVTGDYSGSGDRARPLILLFHMAGSNLGEYAPIAKRLNTLGFDTLAIDQRAGGRLWGRSNETVKAAGRSGDFLGALPDLEAALAFAKSEGRSGPVIAWGSSYSASLVFLLAARHPGEVAGLLAFSPGEYFSQSGIVHSAAAKVTVPVFVTTASSGGEIAEAKDILAAVASKTKVQFVPKSGEHGSSTLRNDSNAAGAEENWQAVERFLAQFRAK